MLQILSRQNDENISNIINLTNSTPDLLDNDERDHPSIIKYIIKYPSSEEAKQQTNSIDKPASDILSPPALAVLSSDEERIMPTFTGHRQIAKQTTQPTTYGPMRFCLQPYKPFKL